jgi:hypothetical protein
MGGDRHPPTTAGETHVNADNSFQLREFWNNANVKSLFVVGTACPTGEEYRHDTDTEDESDYCDLTDLIVNLSPHVDLFDLSGTVDGDSWTWDGVGNPRDVRGNSYTRIVVRGTA